MSLFQTIATGFRSVSSQRLRSLLTALGILIGVAAVILTVGIGLGARQYVTNRITALGTNLITVVPGSVTGVGGVRQGLGAASTLTVSDADALADRSVAPDVIAVAPVVQRVAPMVAGSQNWTTSVSGSTPGWLIANNRTVTSGTFFTDADVSAHAHVAVLGATTAQKLFGNQSPIGQIVAVQHVPFQVIGTLSVVGGQGFNNPDDQVVVPLTTAQSELIAGGSLTTVQRILASAPTRDAIGAAYEEVDNLLLQTHHIGSPSQADFQITTQETILSTADALTGALTLLLAGVAGISLLVGGIGVMNIMLVSVTERISEIGLRKALGARRGDILRQFLIEAATLSAFGGLLGVLVGLVCTILLSNLTPMTALFSPAAAVGGVIIAAAIGVGFGVFPAMRAARLAPIEALRAA
ncbi:MAG TPA: ABC transporter permease [Candidatus Dormibacteraeota bacterium]|nr:ABC transporter permease [Candidatus Dormibacteraeota bacterium]